MLASVTVRRSAAIRNAPTRRSIKHVAVTAAGVALFGLLAPASAAPPQEFASDPRSHLPWLAPVGHRQPRLADIPPDKSLTTLERAQQRFNARLDDKLIICRC